MSRARNSRIGSHVREHMRVALTAWLLGVHLLGCAAPTPPPSMTQASPPPPPTAAPMLGVGGIATAVGFIHLQTAAGIESMPGEPDAGNLEPGSLAYVMAGPERRAGVEWWLVQSERSLDVGWAPTEMDGAPMLIALDPDCPPVATLTVDEVIGIGRVRGLVCFGDRPLTFDANVICFSAAIDGGAGGASWMDSNRLCRTVGDPAMALFGQEITSTLGADLAANPVTARFRITGHYDDPESTRCWDVPVGVNLDSAGEADPDAVIVCRQRFVVSEARRLE